LRRSNRCFAKIPEPSSTLNSNFRAKALWFQALLGTKRCCCKNHIATQTNTGYTCTVYHRVKTRKTMKQLTEINSCHPTRRTEFRHDIKIASCHGTLRGLRDNCYPEPCGVPCGHSAVCRAGSQLICGRTPAVQHLTLFHDGARVACLDLAGLLALWWPHRLDLWRLGCESGGRCESRGDGAW